MSTEYLDGGFTPNRSNKRNQKEQREQKLFDDKFSGKEGLYLVHSTKTELGYHLIKIYKDEELDQYIFMDYPTQDHVDLLSAIIDGIDGWLLLE